jgi:phage-related protein
MAKKKAKVTKKKRSPSSFRTTVSSTASSVIDEIDKAREVVVREIRDGFNIVSNRASGAADKVADATTSVRGTISEVQPKELVLKLVDEVEEIADDIIGAISSRFSKLRDTASEAEKKQTVKKKATRKKVAKKKGNKVARKKTVKKAAPGKKAAKKKAARKKVAKKKAVKK